MFRLLSQQLVTVSKSSPALSKMPWEVPKVKGRMFSIQAALPKFPVAPLQQTMEKYLKTVEPLLTPEELENTKKLCDEFQNGVGRQLQARLQDRANKTTNWLSDWWKSVAYLDVRCPVTINSNPGVLFPRGEYTDLDGQLKYAAKLIAGMLDYKIMIDEQTLPVEHLGKNPLCMMQYYQILSACRVPGTKHDDWFCFPPDKPNAPSHITVVYKNTFYSLDVYGHGGKPLNIKQLYKQLKWIVENTKKTGPAVGILTMEHRHNWAKSYKRMMKDPINRYSLEDIQRSILVLCIDEPLQNVQDAHSEYGGAMLHGGGSKVNSANRWFDKTIQLIVGGDGFNGLNYEHTTAEGPPIISLADHCVKFIKEGKETLPASSVNPPRELEFNLSSSVKEDIKKAEFDSDNAIKDVDLKVLNFTEFGKDFPKSQKLSPDSFLQNAIQLAYYRIHKQPCGSYESASIRMFQFGRTDTIRSCSLESLEFSKAMLDSKLPVSKKAELLRRAVSAHKQYTNDAISGKGIDRHLLGLKLTAIEYNIDIPEHQNIFMDPAYSISGTWRISTSQVPAKFPSLLFFGPVVPDGYGICYNPREKELLIGVSSFKHCSDTVSAGEMANNIKDSLLAMRDVLAATMKSNL